ncbi:MAG: S24/S26 family peptidase [Clostridia bacterium]|nr:S24/S26 family peptidase [Clostridia bacterium]
MQTVESILERDGVFTRMAKGHSMYPMIRSCRDQIIVEKLTRAPKLYEVVLYKRECGTYTLHRVIRKKGDVYIIWGDNCDYVEEIALDQILGVLVGFYRGNKYIDCRKNILYKIYSVSWRFVRPFYRLIRPLGSKIKRKLNRK